MLTTADHGASTIFAVSSGAGRAGVAVVRLSGPRTREALTRLTGPLPPPRHASLRLISDPRSGEPLDRGLVLWFPAPASFTGEDVGELHVHGGRAILDGLLDALAATPGLRPAEAGEFTRRAFVNGQLDLTAAEALADLIEADTAAQRRQALAQASGRLATTLEAWRARLIEAGAAVEAAIDFTDEGDVPATVARSVRPAIEALRRDIGAALATGRGGEILREGFRVVLAGAPNAGKSSLLNWLAQRDVVIVSEEAGTTRDLIEVRLDLAGLPVIVTDTAGVRDTASRVEQEGIRRALARASAADLVLWLVDAAAPEPTVPDAIRAGRARCLKLLNKTDLVRAPLNVAACGCDLAISVHDGTGLDDVLAHLTSLAREAIGLEDEARLTRPRHRAALTAVLGHLERYLAGSADDLELRAEDLRAAAAELGRLTGRIDPEDILDQIFSSFCIGK
ncbi:MAG: tRNA uridine-5-carboxymethylaminomethyl(34) synthesis GTPase MnmE [Hyphomicrobiaceae bacterium]|nr:tRNA uridine-5-carboxymethylaminomethyl(34) synthesis GTPase MnmE [Hyphomicrobiaceae bacterium]